jgi:hypothetical protein
MSKEKNIENNEKIEASNTNQTKIVLIPIDKIKPCRWGTGIRDREVFERLKENIRLHGLNSPVRIFPLGNSFYEPYIGDHRVAACRDLGYKEIPCIVDEIDENQALERCISDNLCRADYSSVELENKVTELWNSGRYQAKVVLGAAIGLSGQRCGQLLGAKVIRDKAKIPFDASISTQCINDTSPLIDINEKLALLELVRERKIKPSDVKDWAKTLAQSSEEKRRRVLYEGEPLDSISKISLPKKTIASNTHVHNPNFLIELYNTLNVLEDHMALITDESKKKEAINYVKFYTGLFMKILTQAGAMHADVFNDLMKHYLKIDKSLLHDYDGKMTKALDYYLGSDPNDDAKEIIP